MFPLPSSSQILFNEFIVFNLTIGYILMKGFIHNVCSLPPTLPPARTDTLLPYSSSYFAVSSHYV